MMTYTAILPSYWASALINGDWSGLSDDEATTLEHILNERPEWAAPVDCADAGFCWGHDATPYGVLAGDCQQFTYLVPAEARRPTGYWPSIWRAKQ